MRIDYIIEEKNSALDFADWLINNNYSYLIDIIIEDMKYYEKTTYSFIVTCCSASRLDIKNKIDTMENYT